MLSLVRPAAAVVSSGKELGGLAGFVETIKPVLPIPALLAILPIVWLFFRDTWREIDEDSQRQRAEVLARGKGDLRPFVALVLCALILTMQEYYGGRAYFEQAIFPSIVKAEATRPWLHTSKYDDLWSFSWWAGTRIFGYVLPFAVWKVTFRKDSILDLGLRTRGFFDHAWIYGLFLAVVLPAMLVVAQNPDFGAYYPFYKATPRSWFDFLVWEAMYFAQFFALEMFFRGFWLGVLRRSFGSGAIFVMAVPYCMIHFGKPYLEACGAIVAGIALGSLSMKTRSIYQGFLVHITVAALMDWLSLRHRHCTPLTFWPTDDTSASLWALTFKKCEDTEARDAMARSIEHVAVPILAVLLVIVVALVIRTRRAKTMRA